MTTSRREGRVGIALSLAAAIALLLSPGAMRAADDVLFPAPLHLTREVADGISRNVTRLEEYAHGNRVVTMTPARTAIADFGAQTITVIDFAAGTYSVTSFGTIAALRSAAARTRKGADSDWRPIRRERRMVGARLAESVELERSIDGIRQSIRISADRELLVTRAAAEALLGSGYPNRSEERHHGMLDALRVERSGSITANSIDDGMLRLPLEQIERYELDGEVIESRNTVVRVGHELPPPERMAIPPGARRVDSKEVEARRVLDEIDGRERVPH